ncbi:TPA: hypothetical protein G8O64_004640 [Salmonella enterica]|uniref:Fimbrial protein n=2 Tax=Salmonella enterica TaxID=28901 RepID=A0A765FTH2_SALER|nr:hypothetical protein [Salmonella enterica]ECA1898283.1 hypothetical protein [Salmonella enterica subsp. enterica serovar Eastbourne]HAC6678845.1 hypothetical protein [Salmonella enterica subsp. enterica serovar Eastbourne]HAE5116308.1 hypothetical protein [Salmonella enterica subsp. enterica serovar Eastbourne]HAG1883063.1 hypothetical protein [Salmonella enterica]
MEVKKIWYTISGLLIYTGINISVAADSVDTQLFLRMDVVNVTCLINDGAGINQQVNLPLASQAELRAGTAKSGLAKLMVDCSKNLTQPASFEVSLAPSGGVSAVGSGADGILRTDLSGVALKLVWKINGQPASLAFGDYSKFFPSASTPQQWDLSLLVTPQYIPGENIEKGFYKSAVKVNIIYI